MDIGTYEDFEEIRVRDVYIVDVFTDPTPVVLLEDLQGNMLPIYIGHLEALSIGNVIKNISPPRPLAHAKGAVKVERTLKAGLSMGWGVWKDTAKYTSDTLEKQINSATPVNVTCTTERCSARLQKMRKPREL